ncbi:MAG: ATP-dependent protease ATPase subunit HslU [Spirochaetia bacterium]
MLINLEKMTPKEIVAELDKYIIGQNKAKRAVAVALRNRFRRSQLPDDIRDEVIPKNIIMIGPTGVGKTEIARRLTKLSGAPFLKVEASKFTEVGYVGRDAESMVRDLISNAVAMVKAEMMESVKDEAQQQVEERILDLLLPKPSFLSPSHIDENTPPQSSDQNAQQENVREKFRIMLRAGELDERKVEVTSQVNPFEGFLGGAIDVIGIEPMERHGSSNPPGGIGQLFSRSKQRNVSVKQAKEILLMEERDKLMDIESVQDIARERTERGGIIFIDEIDKIATRSGKGGGHGPDISREGVQRDILPIIEGTTVNTKYGVVDTQHILFIAAGAFHVSKPSDLLPELQGRFPVQVELEEMSAEMFEKILTQPQNALIRQYTELMKTENVHLVFKDEAIKKLALIAAELNSNQENIGTRRLHAVLETLLEDLSFHAADHVGQTITIDESYIDTRFEKQREKHDLKKYIL